MYPSLKIYIVTQYLKEHIITSFDLKIQKNNTFTTGLLIILLSKLIYDNIVDIYGICRKIELLKIILVEARVIEKYRVYITGALSLIFCS